MPTPIYMSINDTGVRDSATTGGNTIIDAEIGITMQTQGALFDDTDETFDFKTDGESETHYKVIMEDVMISSFSPSGGEDDTKGGSSFDSFFDIDEPILDTTFDYDFIA